MSSKSSLQLASQTEILHKRGYKIISKLGEGCYSKVYLGEFTRYSDDASAQPIQLAVKIMNSKHELLEFNQKFLPRELYILTLISHPHIIHIHSILQIKKSYYIFMRLAEQGDLLEFILKYGVINENQARVWTQQIALALQYLHELNIAHRDIKCENVLVTMNFNVKLTDFGFARYTIDSTNIPILSETYCGSMAYVPPEILIGQPYNPKISDLWSFGVVIYVMLNKSMPFDESSPMILYEKQMKRHFKFRSKVAHHLSNEVKGLIDHLLEPDPIKRYCIDAIINSDWIAMDKRLTVLKPMELAALSAAFQIRKTPPEHFSLPKSHKPSRATEESILESSGSSVSTIKSYNFEPRISDDSQVPMVPVDQNNI